MTLCFIGLVGVAAFMLCFATLTQIGAYLLVRRRAPNAPDVPTNYGIPYVDIQFLARDDTPLVGWWIPSTADMPRGTVIMCHGQAGSMDGDTPQMVPLHAAGFNVLMFNFRAHGHSGGKYLTMGMYEKEDLLGALDYLAEAHGIERAAVLGFSMGAAAAMITASITDRISVIVADGCFVRFKNSMARWLRQRGVPSYHVAWHIAAWTLAAAALRTGGRIDQVDVALWAKHVKCPVLFIHGEADPLISRREIETMATLCQGPTDLWMVPNVGHRGAFGKEQKRYNDRIIEWITRYTIQTGDSIHGHQHPLG